MSKLLEFYIDIAVRAGNAVSGLTNIERRSDQAKSALARVGNAAEKLGLGMAKAGALIVTAATPALINFGRGAIEASRSAEEAASKFATVMGASATEAQLAADKLAAAQGRSVYRTRQSVGDIAALARGYGFAEQEAANFALKIQQMGVDLASFHNQSDADTINALRSAMAGEFEPLAGRAGIKLNAEQIKQQLKLLGIDEKRATSGEKLQATILAIQRAAEKQGALGDAERTKGSRTNVAKSNEGATFDAQVNAGEKLAELDRKVLALKGKAAEIFLGMDDSAQTAVLAVGGVIAVLGNLGTALQAVVAWKLMSATATTAETTATAANTGGLWANFVARTRLIAASAVTVAAWAASTIAAGANTSALWLNTAAQRAWAVSSALVAGGARLVTRAFNLMKVALLTNPIGLAVTAIAGAAYLIYRNWDWLKAKFIQIWNIITARFTANVEIIKGVWAAVSGFLSSTWAALWSGIKSTALAAINAVTAFVSGLMSKIETAISKVKELVGIAAKSPAGLSALGGTVAGPTGRLIGTAIQAARQVRGPSGTASPGGRRPRANSLNGRPLASNSTSTTTVNNTFTHGLTDSQLSRAMKGNTGFNNRSAALPA